MVTQTEVQRIIQDRMKELQELRHNVDVLKVSHFRSARGEAKTFTFTKRKSF